MKKMKRRALSIYPLVCLHCEAESYFPPLSCNIRKGVSALSENEKGHGLIIFYLY